MICFPHAKINIGLRIIEKRSDGYHSIESIFYPVFGLYDSLEWIESSKLTFESTGHTIDGDTDSNLCVRAWNILHQRFSIPPIHIFLQKQIPLGAGLGGGSSDAAHMLTSLVNNYNLPVSQSELHSLALSLGSDCPFFLQSNPLFGEGRGDEFSGVSLSLEGYWLVLANPGVHVSTAHAYSQVCPKKHSQKLHECIPPQMSKWSSVLQNDFEASVFALFPQIAQLKVDMYAHGALYASMSGSGSTVFGVFHEKPVLPNEFPVIWQGLV